MSEHTLSADEAATAAAQTLDPAAFEPFVKALTEGAYEKLMDTVQDYLIENATFNIASRIEYAENEARRLRELLATARDYLGDIARGRGPELATDHIKIMAADDLSLIDVALRYPRQTATLARRVADAEAPANA